MASTQNPRTRPGGMTPDGPKVREAILCVIDTADRRGVRLTQFQILKALFIADREHLNRYGRPVTFDDYAAMKDGPVPSLAYDVLKNSRSSLHEARIDQPLWKTRPLSGGKIEFFSAQRSPSDEVLSDSDMEALTDAAGYVIATPVPKVWERVHEDRAYLDAWSRKSPDHKQHPMDMALFFDKPNDEMADAIKFFAANQ